MYLQDMWLHLSEISSVLNVLHKISQEIRLYDGAVIRARAPTLGGPIEIVRIFLLLIIISLLGLFQGLDMLQFSPKFAGRRKPQKSNCVVE